MHLTSTKNLNDLLKGSLRSFGNADYHPFGDIENQIREALATGTIDQKIALLKRIRPLLAQSDLPTVRIFGDVVQKVLEDK